MRILLVSATIEEIKPSLHYIQQHQLSYLITGVGMTATAFQLGYALKDNKYDLILNVGIAGSFSKELLLGSVVRVKHDRFIELGAEDNDRFLSLEELGFGKSTFSENIDRHLQQQLEEYTCVHGITVNQVHGNESSIIKIRTQLPALTIESMEGAAVFYVAHQLNLPVLQLRSISNYVEARDREAWNIPLAIEELNNKLTQLLERLV